MRFAASGLLIVGSVFLGSCATTGRDPSPAPEVAEPDPLTVRDQNLLWEHARSGVTPALGTRRAGGIRIQCCELTGVVENPITDFASPFMPTPDGVGVSLKIAWIADPADPGTRFYCSPSGGVSGEGGASGAIFMFVDTPVLLDWGSGRAELPPAHSSLGARFGDRWRPIGGEVVAALAGATRINGSIPTHGRHTPIRFRIEADAILTLRDLLQYTSDD